MYFIIRATSLFSENTSNQPYQDGVEGVKIKCIYNASKATHKGIIIPVLEVLEFLFDK